MARFGPADKASTPKNMWDTASVILPEMVRVPAGNTWLGTSNKQVMDLYEKEDWAREWFEDDLFRFEQPQHQVYVPAFDIAKYPITNIEYYRFIWQNSHRVPKGWIGFRFPEGFQHYPVVNVSWNDAREYCEWLSRKTGEKYRLLNEAEWERAARGNDTRNYPWGDDFDPWRCNTLESNKGGPTEVGSYSPAGDSPFGVAEMSGNVWEWTCSPLIPYPFDAEGKPEDGKKPFYVHRGGAWYYSRKLARCSSREGMPADYTSNSLGFRVARTVIE